MQPERVPTAPAGTDWREYLRQVSIFADLAGNPAALAELYALMELKSFRPGQDIMKEGEAGSELYILVEGEASVYKSTAEGDTYRVAILKAEYHAVLGEGGLLGADARSATIRAESTCRCLMLSRGNFEAFAQKSPQWALPVTLRIARAVMDRLKKVNNDLMLLYNALVAEVRGS